MKYKDISGIPLFKDISEADFMHMAGCLGYGLKTYKKDEFIILEDENIKNVGIVLSGAVHMLKEDIWGNRALIAYISFGELIGESFVFGNVSRSIVTFKAAAKTEIMFLNFDKIIHICSSACVHHRKLADNMIYMIASKNISLMEKIEVTSKKSLREKLLAYLSIQSQKNNSIYFEIPLGRVELAEYLCADRSQDLVKSARRIQMPTSFIGRPATFS